MGCVNLIKSSKTGEKMKLNKCFEKSSRHTKFLSSGLLLLSAHNVEYLGVNFNEYFDFNDCLCFKDVWSFECKSGRKTQYSLKFRKYK